jgi:hypothetical protein
MRHNMDARIRDLYVKVDITSRYPFSRVVSRPRNLLSDKSSRS